MIAAARKFFLLISSSSEMRVPDTSLTIVNAAAATIDLLRNTPLFFLDVGCFFGTEELVAKVDDASLVVELGEFCRSLMAGSVRPEESQGRHDNILSTLKVLSSCLS